MSKKLALFAALSAAFTLFLYVFGAFVSFKLNIADWHEPGRFLTALIWTAAHAALASIVFGTGSSDA